MKRFRPEQRSNSKSEFIQMSQNLTSLKLRSKSLADSFPRIESLRTAFAKDFELPGFPTKKRGIRNSTQIAIMKIFSRNAAFLAMFFPRVILSKKVSSHL